MSHPSYRAVFPHVRWSESSQTIRLAHGGSRGAHVASPGGGITGRGADIIIIDDPLGASHADDDSRREQINRWYDQNIYQRLNDKAKGVVIVVMQRLHIDDLAGHLLKQEGWEHLSLPAIANEDERYPRLYGDQIVRRQGEALHPGLEDRDQYRQMMQDMGAVSFMSQYQQHPYPPGKGRGYHGAITILPKDPRTPLSHGGMFFSHLSEERILLEKVFGEPLGLMPGCPPPMMGEEWEACYGGPRETPELNMLPQDMIPKIRVGA
jgi:hypothetical protein